MNPVYKVNFQGKTYYIDASGQFYDSNSTRIPFKAQGGKIVNTQDGSTVATYTGDGTITFAGGAGTTKWTAINTKSLPRLQNSILQTLPT
jgi:hypothetical protein